MKRVIAKNAPDAIGPYNHATVFNDIVFTSGQIGLDPATGKLVDGIENQTKQTLNNIRNILEASGSDFDHILKATIYVDDLSNFSVVNSIYEDYFAVDFPARTAMEVSKLPMDAKVEIEAVAEKKN